MRIIAHRSGPRIYPEQTILSAKDALTQGADMIEIDVRSTSDKKLAVFHDDAAGRILGVDKEICDMTATEFLSLRHKENPEFCPHVFEDYLKCSIAPLLIHIKQDEVFEELFGLINQYNYADKVVIGAVSLDFVKRVKKEYPQVKVLAFMNGADDSAVFADAGADYIRFWQGWINEERLSAVRSTGKELWIMTSGSDVGVPTKENLLKTLAIKPDGILINDVTFLKECMEEI